jgi:hypothetical protein
MAASLPLPVAASPVETIAPIRSSIAGIDVQCNFETVVFMEVSN